MSRDQERDNRIAMEIVVDAYDAEERSLGWYYYLEDRLAFPFPAKCTQERSISPLQIGESVNVVGMSDEDDCRHEVIVLVEWSGRTFGAPLSQLEPVGVDAETQEAIDDWHYWVAQGYEF
jgi:hypothetical protein